MMTVRRATIADVPAINELIVTSVRQLSASYYTPAQIDAALTGVFGADTQLVADGTYFVIDAETGLAAAGGWSGRRTLFGGDQTKHGEDPRLDSDAEPARIRAFFVHPDHARRGLARRLYAECEHAALAAGFRRFELMATLPGEPLYVALGFTLIEQMVLPLPAGEEIRFVHMGRDIP
jgi:GNAT superfamily N-acetyltransferase